MNNPRTISRDERAHLWLRYWLPALLWLVVVAVFSTHFFGSSHTFLWLKFLLRVLHVQLSAPEFEILHYAIRKAAHFTAYGLLSGLMFRAVRGTDLARKIWKARYALIALGTCALAASLDEIHQFFTPGRTGNWHDVVLDLCGALFVQVTILFTVSSRWGQSRWRAGTNSSTSAAVQANAAER